MSKMITIKPEFFVDIESTDAAVGYEMAQDAWIKRHEGGDHAAVCSEFVTEMMATVLAHQACVAPTMFGAVSFFIEMASKNAKGVDQ